MIDKVLHRLGLLEAELAQLDPAREVADRVAAMARALRDTAGAMSDEAAGSRGARCADANTARRRAAG